MPSPCPPPAPAPWRRPPGAREHPDHLIADLVGISVKIEQDARRDTLVLTHQAQEDVLGTDVVVTEGERLPERQLENLLGTRGEGDLTRGDLLAGADDPDHLGANPFDRDIERLEDPGREPLLLAQQTEQDVLGADVVVLERARLLLRQDDDLTGSLCESLEQKTSLPSPTLFRRGSTADPFRLSGGIHVPFKRYRECPTGFRSSISALSGLLEPIRSALPEKARPRADFEHR